MLGADLCADVRIGQQICKVALALGDHMEVRCNACIGGTSVRDDIDELRDGQHILVYTPSRGFDMSSKCLLRIDDRARLFL